MAAPVTTFGAYGGLIAPISVAAGKTVAALLDLASGGNAALEGRVSCEIATGSAPTITVGTTFSAYEVMGNSSQITVSTFTSSTSIAVSSATGMHLNQVILIQQAGGSKLGELATITGISGTTLTVNTLTNTYSSGDLVYLIDQTASFAAQPGGPTSTWAATHPYSAMLSLPSGQWCIGVSNGDGTYPVTVSASVNKITGFQ